MLQFATNLDNFSAASASDVADILFKLSTEIPDQQDEKSSKCVAEIAAVFQKFGCVQEMAVVAAMTSR